MWPKLLALLYCSDRESSDHGWHTRGLITHPAMPSCLGTSLFLEWYMLMEPLSRGWFLVFRCCTSSSVPTFLNFLFFSAATVKGYVINTLMPVNKPSIFLPNRSIQQDYLAENLICQKCMCETVQTLRRIYSPESQCPYSLSYSTTNSYHHWDWLNLQIWAPEEPCYPQRHKNSNPCTTEQVVHTCPNGT